MPDSITHDHWRIGAAVQRQQLQRRTDRQSLRAPRRYRPGFRVRTSDLDIPAVFHRFSERIRAHTLICFLALFLCRVMRMHLKENGNADSLKTPFEFLHPRQTHRVYIGKMRLTGIGKTTPQQRELFAALGIKKPS